MRFTLLHILLGVVATSMAVPSGVEPGVELLPTLIPKTERRQVSVIDGLKSRQIGGGFIAVLPQVNSIPADGDSGSDGKRRFLRKDEVVVPESLQAPSSKRAPTCSFGWGLCSGKKYCCPAGGDCCSDGSCCDIGQQCCGTKGCCPLTSECVTVDGQDGCCPISQRCVAGGTKCAVAGYVPCSNDNFCCKPGYTCSRDSLGDPVCKASDDDTSTTKRTTTTTTKRTTTTTTTTKPDDATPTTFTITEDTTTTDPTSFAFPTTTPTPSAASNTTSSVSRTSSSPEAPTAAANGAGTVSFQGYCFLMAPVLFALGHALGK